jgi:hypothetical protein
MPAWLIGDSRFHGVGSGDTAPSRCTLAMCWSATATASRCSATARAEEKHRSSLFSVELRSRTQLEARTCVRYAAAVGTWHDPDLGRPIAAPLERCAELLGVDLATVRELAGNVEPYIRADGVKIWSLMLLERQLRPEAYGRRRGGYLDRRRNPPADP